MTLDLAVAYKTPKGQAMKVKQNHIKIKKILNLSEVEPMVIQNNSFYNTVALHMIMY